MALKKASSVWRCFEKVDGDKIKCKNCDSVFKDFKNTTNLLKHLKKAHPIIYSTHIDNNSTTPIQSDSDILSEASGSGGPLKKDKNSNPSQSIADGETPPPRKRQLQMTFPSKQALKINSKNVDKALIKMVCIDFQPLQVVENTGFQEYTRTLNPNYELPSRKILSEKMIPEQYSTARKATQEMLKAINYIALTTDLWTSDSSKSYMTLTIHFINEDTFKSLTISTREVKDAHTSENLAREIKDVLETEWNILDKIICVTTDNAANIKKAVVEILQKRHHSCAAHTLNLVAQDAIKDNELLNRLIEKCRGIVAYFRRSNNAAYKLRQVQEQMQLEPLKLKQDVQTRWNSVYYMLEGLDKIKIPLSAAITSLPGCPDNLNAEEWIEVHECLVILKPVEQMTSIISGEQYPTLSCIIPLIRGVQAALRNCSCNSEVASRLNIKLQEVFDRRFGGYEINKTAAKSTFIDPRFKKAAFGLERNAENALKFVVDELVMLETLESQAQSHLERPSTSSADSQQITTEATGENNLWEHLDKRVQEFSNMDNPSTSAIIKVKQYVELPYLDRKANPLKFWELRKVTNNNLYKIALKYLCIPATSVPSERVFSKAGLLCNQRRNRLESKKVDQILFLNSYFK
ncbi:hypothetical protein ABMA27_004567 [Loxostege sticticalis]|uniref:BED-type domain-containing protein n=1 Tax=Loxostege sticticalis TaxID=481309 RepID=A0ABR3HP49_LOXSC